MSITSFTFILFVFAVMIVYYLIPRRWQWTVLLAASCIFYLMGGKKTFLFVLITAASIYIAARLMQNMSDGRKAYLKEHKKELSKEEKKDYKKKVQSKRKWIMIAALVLNFGLLCVFKYFHFALEQINAIISMTGGTTITDTFKLIVPLGISFYTFQSTGYLVDVYWENISAEKNFAKFLLFVSFFPQMTQGPISEFEQLSNELFSGHELRYENYSRGFQRMLWGFMKKMLLANLIAPYVNDVFHNYPEYTGITVFVGALMYSVQIYADFSGYMDIMCGMCEMLGIHLAENFERPYFSKSVAEYWRRWHITLGAWFKRYIYFPVAMSNWSRKLAWASRDRFGKFFSDTLPATIALVIVWFCTGLWHGASWAYIIWGLVNGFFIILSLWLEKLYTVWKRALHINESKWAWRAFQTIRTFILVTFIKVLPEVGTLSDGWGLWMRIFTEHSIPHEIHELLPALAANGKKNFCIILAMILLQFIFSLLQRKKPVRDYFAVIPLPLRMMAMAGCVILIIVFGLSESATSGGFMYAQF